MMLPSLRRNLVLILLAITVLVWLVAMVVTALLAQSLVVRQVERQLVQYIDMAHHSMSVIASSEEVRLHYWRNTPKISREAGITRVGGFGSQGSEQAANAWFDDHQVVVGELAPAFPQPVEEGFMTWKQAVGDGTVHWRVLYRYDPELNIWLAVGVDLNHAANIGRVTLLRAVLPLLVILPLTIALFLWGVRRGLRPLDQLAATIEARDPHALEPIDEAGIPVEIQPVVSALNGLLGRLQRALASESRFTANAAHELQTPLAAIKAEVQRYQLQSGGELHDRDMLARISERVTRASSTVGQLLTLARLDPEQEFQRERVDLNELLLESIAEEGGVAVERELDIQLTECPGIVVEAHRDWLQIMLRNLVGNAFRHAPSASAVEIRLSHSKEGAVLYLANDCEPLSPAERERLLDRFSTRTESATSGVGLGLSIAKRIAELHGATLSLSAREGGQGFAVELVFPAG